MVLEGEKCQAHVGEDEVFSQEIQQLEQLETQDNSISKQIFNKNKANWEFFSHEALRINVNSSFLSSEWGRITCVTCLVLLFDSAERLLYV